MSSLTITVNIAGRAYRINVESEKEEETIRKSAEKINAKVKQFADSFSYKDHQDLIAMVCLDLTASSLSEKSMSTTQQKELINSLHLINDIL